MPLSVRVAATTLPAKALKLLAGGALRPAKTVKVMRGGLLATATTFGSTSPNFTVAVAPDYAAGYSRSRGLSRVTTNYVGVTPSGGIAPYTYAWGLVDGDAVTIGSPSMASTSFSATLFNEIRTATALCTVTDAAGSTATCTVAVSLEHESVGGGIIP